MRKSHPIMSIVVPWAPQITPKWSPKWSQGNNGRPLRNIHRHGRIACPPPPIGELHFSSSFKDQKTYNKNIHKSIAIREKKKCCSKMTSNRTTYFGGTKISQNGHLGDLGLCWGPDGGPDSQNYQNDLQNDPQDTNI